MLISGGYRELNTKLHKDRDGYGAGGGGWREVVNTLTEHYETRDVLDYGCGKGTLAEKLKFPINEYDPCIEGKDALPQPADIVVCTDVLEHIEPNHLAEVLDHLASLVKVVGFFTIATRPAKKKLADGRNAHLIIMPADWWLLKLEKRFRVVRWEVDKHRKGEVLALVKPWRK